MPETADAVLRRTPLHDRHRAAGARLVPFAGWEMPVQYDSVIEEHRAVRERAGLFDVSHMGEVVVRGPGAETFLQRLTPNDVARLAIGQAHYSGLLTPRGTYVDDLLVYRLGEADFLLVVNAANRETDLAWILDQDHPETEIEDVSDRWALLALQGPRAAVILARLTDADLAGLKYYRFTHGEVAGRPALISRTGYTGEDGFELYVEPDDAAVLWDALLAAGEPEGLIPAGLGARDTLRLEAGMALYGHELDASTTPFEAGLDWVVKLDKGDFLGRDALVAQRQRGVDKRLVGLELDGRGIAREGHALRVDGDQVGQVTSGTWSPTFGKAIAMGYLPATAGDSGLEVDIRGRVVPVRRVDLPFYRRTRR